MANLNQSPIAERMIDADTLKCRPAWQQYFDSVSAGDVGTTWSPQIMNLTSVGAPTITGVYYQNQGFVDFYVKIVPATNTSSVAGSTYILLPFTVNADSGGFVVEGSACSLAAINASSGFVYLPTWTAQTSPITVSGRVKA